MSLRSLQSQKQVEGGNLVSPMDRASDGAIVVFVPEIVAWGGGERVYLSLLRHLHNSGRKYRFVSYVQSVDLRPFADFPLNIETLEPKRGPLNKAMALRKFLKALPPKPKPLLFNLQSATHAFFADHRNFCVMILDTPSLLDLPGKGTRSFEFKQRVFNKLVTKALKNVDPVVATTNYMADEMRSLWQIEPVVSRQGVHPIELKGHYRSIQDVDPFEIVSVCRLESNKRVDWILDAFSSLESGSDPLSRSVNWKLTIVGDGSLASELKDQCRRLGLDKRVMFAGFVSDEELEDIYRNTNLSLMPAVQGYGLPALEALTRRIPVVLHADSGVSEILVDSPWARVFTGGVTNLAESIKALSVSVVRGGLANVPLPRFPTDDEWAAEVCRLCGWVS